MARPNLETDAGRAAYRAELRRVGWRQRWAGLACIVVAAALVLFARDGRFGLTDNAVMAAYGLLAIGWVLVIYAVFQRTRHHKRRMAEGL